MFTVLMSNDDQTSPTSTSQVSKDSMVGSSCKIGDRCSVKKTIIGNHCSLAANVKLTNCIVMDHVRIEEGYVLLRSLWVPSACVLAAIKMK